MTPNSDPKRELLRHTVATLAYRGGKAVRNAPAGFAEFRGCPSGRTAGQILAHLGDLLDWGLSIAQGKQSWKNSEPLPWDKETDRFFAALKSFDDYLASPEPLHVPAGEALSGSGCRRPDPRGADRDAAPDGRRADKRRRTISSLRSQRPCGTRSRLRPSKSSIEAAVAPPKPPSSKMNP